MPLNPSDVRYNWDTALLYDTAGPTEKFTRVFNNTGRELSELNYVMDAGNWVVFSRVRITYDVSGNLLTLLTESWDKAGNGWANLKRNRFAYDANGNSTNGNCEEWKAGAWGPGMSSISVYSQQKLVYTFWWPLHYQYQATFTSYSSGVNEIDNPKLCIKLLFTADRHLNFLVTPNPIVRMKSFLPGFVVAAEILFVKAI